MRLDTTAAAFGLALMLSACGGGAASQTGRVQSTTTVRPPPPPTRPPVRRPQVPNAQVQVLPGLETVIGATQADLARQFGQPRLEVWEGDARKLQFTGSACVLDVYLYPPTGGGPPIATYTDARRASDGKDVDRAACVAALKSG